MYSQFYNPLNAYRVDKPKISLTNCIYNFKIPQKMAAMLLKLTVLCIYNPQELFKQYFYKIVVRTKTHSNIMTFLQHNKEAESRNIWSIGQILRSNNCTHKASGAAVALH